MQDQVRGWLGQIVGCLVLGALMLPGCVRSRCCPPRDTSTAAPTEAEAEPVVVPETPTAPPVEDTEPAAPAPQAWPALNDAQMDLTILKRSMRSRGTNADILGYLEVTAHAYKTLEPPPTAAAGKVGGAQAAVFDFKRTRYRAEALKLILRCLALRTLRDGRNIREDVNIKAARILGDLAPLLEVCEQDRLSKGIQRAIEKNFRRAKYPVSEDLIENSFAALARLGSMRSFEWMLDDYTHAKLKDVPYLVAAHKALPMFEEVPGKLRYRLVRQFTRAYAGVEAQAQQSSTDPKIRAIGRFWDRVGRGAITAVQHFADHPLDEQGRALDTLRAFNAWFRSHKNVRRAPWTDDESAK